MTLREHLDSHQRQTGRVHPMLAEAPPLPDGCKALWRDFLELHTTRGAGMAGPLRISYSDIDAYQRVRSVRLSPWDVGAIVAADRAYLEVYARDYVKGSR
jgi:hypothetical protein